MKLKSFLAFFMLLALAGFAQAEQDFYGIKMKDERWAKSFISSPPQGKPVTAKGLRIDKSVFADAVLTSAPPETNEVRISVVNDSASPLRTEYATRDFFIYMKDGRKIPLIDPEFQQDIRSVPVKKSAEFRPSLGSLSVNHEDVAMIEVSFGMGATRIFLFPRSQKEEIRRLKNPEVQKKNSLSELKPVVKSVNFAPAKAVVGKPAKTGVSTGNSGAEKRLDETIKNFKYVPSDIAGPKMKRPASASSPQKSEDARVVEFNKKFNYIVFDRGLRSGVKKDDLVEVSRDGKIIAQARVKQLREAYAAASITSDPGKADIRAGDSVLRHA